MTRGQRGRDLATAVLAFAAIFGFVLAPFLYIVAPAGFRGMFPQSGWQVTGALVVAAIGLGIGFIWIVRIFSADPEADHRAWRYRNGGARTSKPEAHPSDMTRGQSGRFLARVELGVAAGIGFVVTPFLYVAAPDFMGPQPPAWQVVGSLVVGAAGILIGFFWMVRIYRADPEPDQRAWRYRARD